MRFNNGYLGACIIVLGVIATIVVSYALSVEVTNEEVTDYSYVADLNGLFESEQAPAFTEYNPSTNYTGYYTQDSVVGNNKYFAGVYFTKSAQPNAFRVNLQPEFGQSGTMTLNGSDWKENAHVSLMGLATFNTGNTAGGVWSNIRNGMDVRLTDVIASMNLPENVDYLEIKSISGRNAFTEPYPQTQTLVLNWVLFSTTNMWEGNVLRVQTQQYQENYPDVESVKSAPIYLSCTVNLDTKLVTFYTDNELIYSAGTYSIDDVIVSFGGTNSGSRVLNLGTQADYYYGIKPTPTYMDIRGGVEVL